MHIKRNEYEETLQTMVNIVKYLDAQCENALKLKQGNKDCFQSNLKMFYGVMAAIDILNLSDIMKNHSVPSGFFIPS